MHRIFLTTTCAFSGPAVYPPTSEPFWLVCLKSSWTPWPSAQIASSRPSHHPRLRAPVRDLAKRSSCKSYAISLASCRISQPSGTVPTPKTSAVAQAIVAPTHAVALPTDPPLDMTLPTPTAGTTTASGPGCRIVLSPVPSASKRN
jgi:hypothetical protein